MKFSDGGGAQMYAYDVDGDGDNDVVTSKAAHAYGLSWFENVGGDDGEIKFKEHLIMGEKPEENEYGVAFSQLHALALADMDSDGVQDIVTGKRWWAHTRTRSRLARSGRAVLVQDRRAKAARCASFRIRSTTIPASARRWSSATSTATSGPTSSSATRRARSSSRIEAKDVDEATWEAAQPMPTRRRKPQPPAAEPQAAAEPADGFPATAADGRVLNLDFEKGDLADWTADGRRASSGQPIKGDTVTRAAPTASAGTRASIWIGTYERERRRAAGHAHVGAVSR